MSSRACDNSANSKTVLYSPPTLPVNAVIAEWPGRVRAQAALESRGRCDSSWVSGLSQFSPGLDRVTTREHWHFRKTKCWVLSVCQPKQSESCVNIGIRFMLFKLLETDVSVCWIVYVKLQYLEWLCNGWLLFLLPIRSKCDIIHSHMSFSSNSQLNILFFPKSVWSFSLCLETVPSSQTSRRHGRHYYCI